MGRSQVWSIIPGTCISVDYWATTNKHLKLFFLTHAHTDHTQGLTSAWQLPIYCSEMTAKLVHHFLGVAENLLQCLEVGETHVIHMPCSRNSSDTVSVTVLDADHCPGAVMYLFEGSFGRVLHTGDFRFESSNIKLTRTIQQLCGAHNPLDLLFLDNTYMDEKSVFPERQQVIHDIIKKIEAQSPSTRILIAIRRLGKEKLLAALSSHFNSAVDVTLDRLKTLDLIPLPGSCFTINCEDFKMRAIRLETLGKCLSTYQRTHPILAIVPSALSTIKPSLSANDSVVHFSYSDHSSVHELEAFLSIVKTKSVVPNSKPIPQKFLELCLVKQQDNDGPLVKLVEKRKPKKRKFESATPPKQCQVYAKERRSSLNWHKNTQRNSSVKYSDESPTKPMSEKLVVTNDFEKAIAKLKLKMGCLNSEEYDSIPDRFLPLFDSCVKNK